MFLTYHFIKLHCRLYFNTFYICIYFYKFFLQQNFADDTTSYVCDENLAFVLERLEHQSNIALKWFEDKNKKMNYGKFHLFISSIKYEQMWAIIADDKICESRAVKLLGITIDD